MLQDIAMYILDIGNNSIRAKASFVEISFVESSQLDSCTLKIDDDGCGMSAKQLENVRNPFYTTRNTRKVGLGMSFLDQLASQCNGNLVIESEVGKGTKLTLNYQRSHFDAPPIGDIASSMIALIQADGKMEYLFSYEIDRTNFEFDTKQIKELLDGVSITEPSILLWLKDYIDEGLKRLKEE